MAAVAAATGVAGPTLLCSRPRVAAEAAKLRPQRPAPAPLDEALESTEAVVPALRVKNTFLEGAAQLSPSLEHFYRARAVHTCPSKHAGRLVSLMQEMANNDTESTVSPAATLLAIETPCNIKTPLAEEAPQVVPCQPFCDMPFLFPSLSMPAQLPTQPGLQCAGMEVAAHFAAPMNLAPRSLAPLFAQEGDHAPRAVLSLADALDSHDVPLQQPGLSTKHSLVLQSSDESRLHQLVPTVDQVADAIADTLIVNLRAPSNPPPPPSGPALGTAELPSIGSSEHAYGNCRPCAFMHTKGCDMGLACKFCHLCGPEERRRRRQEKQQERRQLHKAKHEEQARAAQ